MLSPVASRATSAPKRLSRHEQRALMVRHAAAMRVIKHCNSREQRIALLLAVVCPQTRELREM